MNLIFRLMFTLAVSVALSCSNCQGQDNDKSHIQGSITINGKKIELNGEEIEAWMEENGKDLEKWAEQYAGEWEDWAEKFEYKMERWGAEQEAYWEEWAEKYSGRWEEWAEGLESGEIDPEEIGKLVERNLEMLSDMPLGDLVEGALKEGLGELKNAPWESLGELQELVGGSLEQSLQAMEKELANTIESELKGKLSKLKTTDLQSALKKLQDSVDLKDEKMDASAKAKRTALELLMKAKDKAKKQGKPIDDSLEARVLAILDKELAEVEKAEAKEKKSARKKSKEKASREEVLKIAKEKAMARKKAEAAYRNAIRSKKSVEHVYDDLKKRDAELEDKESEIEMMRKEIKELRAAVEKLSKQKDRR